MGHKENLVRCAAFAPWFRNSIVFANADWRERGFWSKPRKLGTLFFWAFQTGVFGQSVFIPIGYFYSTKTAPYLLIRVRARHILN